jgi:hypothetical protein
MQFVDAHFAAAAREEMAVFPVRKAPEEPERNAAFVRDDDHSVKRARHRVR